MENPTIISFMETSQSVGVEVWLTKFDACHQDGVVISWTCSASWEDVLFVVSFALSSSHLELVFSVVKYAFNVVLLSNGHFGMIVHRSLPLVYGPCPLATIHRSTDGCVSVFMQELHATASTCFASTQTSLSLQVDKTLSQEQQFTPIWKAVHTILFIYFTIVSSQNYLLKTMKCGIYLYICATLRLS